jgi:hypothetical protein
VAQRIVVVEVRLVDVAPAQRDLVPERGAEGVADAAFHLRNDDIRIDRDAAIDGANDLFDLEATVTGDRNFGGLGDYSSMEHLPTRMYARILLHCRGR